MTRLDSIFPRTRIPIFLAIAILAGALAPRPAQAQSSRRSKGPGSVAEWIESVRKAEQRYGEQWSIVVKDLGAGEVILGYHPTERLVPASNRKLLVFALALEKFGPEYRFKTELGYTGTLEAGVVSGSLVLRSNGDPTMSARYLNQKNPVTILRGWIASLASAGVRRVRGDFIIDSSAFGFDQARYPAAWDPSHREHAYAPIPTALALNRNLIQVSVKPSESLGAPGRIRIYPSKEGIGVINRTRTASGRRQGLEARFTEDGRNLVVKGRVGQSIRSHVVSVPHPRPLAYVQTIVKDALEAEGIRLDGRVRTLADPDERPPEGPLTVRMRHESIALIELLRIMMRDSDNFFAEQIWRATAARVSGRGDPASARRVEQAWYRDHGIGWIEPGHDGSGLSRMNRVSAAGLVAILETVYASPYRRYLTDSLPASGRSGTLRARTWSKPAGRVVAKTGTLSDASALAGFIRDRSGKERWAFAVIGNSPRKSNGRLTTRVNQIMKILLGLLDSGRIPGSSPRPPASKKRYKPGTKEYVRRPS